MSIPKLFRKLVHENSEFFFWKHFTLKNKNLKYIRGTISCRGELILNWDWKI